MHPPKSLSFWKLGFVPSPVAFLLVNALAFGVALAAEPASEIAAAADDRAPLATDDSEALRAHSVVLPAGVLVFIDPATGRILERPTEEQQRALMRLRALQAARSGEERDRLLDALEPFPVPGGVGLDVTGLFTSALVVHRGPDGALHYSCREDHAEVPETPPAPSRRQGVAEQ